MVDRTANFAYNQFVRGSAGIGRQVRLRGVCEGVWVQVPSTAPNKKQGLVPCFLFAYESEGT